MNSAALTTLTLAIASLIAAVLLTVNGSDATPAWAAVATTVGAAVGIHVPAPADTPAAAPAPVVPRP